MAVVKTYEENQRTIRVWEESRGSKTLTRRFYLKYRLYIIEDGKMRSTLHDTFSECKRIATEYMDSHAQSWCRYDELATHVGYAFLSKDKGVNIRIFASEEAGERIDEKIE